MYESVPLPKPKARGVRLLPFAASVATVVVTYAFGGGFILGSILSVIAYLALDIKTQPKPESGRAAR